MIIQPLGGIKTPSNPPDPKAPNTNFLSYPRDNMAGIATIPIVRTVAALDPDMAANSPQAARAESDKPPRILRRKTFKSSKRSSPIFARKRMFAMSINSGRDDRRKLSNVWYMVWAMFITSKLLTSKTTKADVNSAMPIGRPNNKRKRRSGKTQMPSVMLSASLAAKLAAL